MREQKWNLGRFIGRSSALLLLFALLFLPSARAEEGENLPKIIIGLLCADHRPVHANRMDYHCPGRHNVGIIRRGC